MSFRNWKNSAEILIKASFHSKCPNTKEKQKKIVCRLLWTKWLTTLSAHHKKTPKENDVKPVSVDCFQSLLILSFPGVVPSISQVTVSLQEKKCTVLQLHYKKYHNELSHNSDFSFSCPITINSLINEIFLYNAIIVPHLVYCIQVCRKSK